MTGCSLRRNVSLKMFLVGTMFGLMLSYLMQTLSRSGVYKESNYVNMPNSALKQEAKAQLNRNIYQDDDSIARELKDRVKVLVSIMTSPDNLRTKALAVRETWGKRCNILFFSSKEDKDFPAIGLNVLEGRDHLTAKTMKASQYLHDNHFNEADWFMKADDDTYVIVENLRYFLSEQNTSDPVYFGHRLANRYTGKFNSAGSGYILSKEALRRFGQNASELCIQDGQDEDVYMGQCMKSLGVRIGDTMDSNGKMRFYAFAFIPFLLSRDLHDENLTQRGRSNISNYAISFHRFVPGTMLMVDLFLYHIQTHGVVKGTKSLNKKEQHVTRL